MNTTTTTRVTQYSATYQGRDLGLTFDSREAVDGYITQAVAAGCAAADYQVMHRAVTYGPWAPTTSPHPTTTTTEENPVTTTCSNPTVEHPGFPCAHQPGPAEPEEPAQDDLDQDDLPAEPTAEQSNRWQAEGARYVDTLRDATPASELAAVLTDRLNEWRDDLAGLTGHDWHEATGMIRRAQELLTTADLDLSANQAAAAHVEADPYVLADVVEIMEATGEGWHQLAPGTGRQQTLGDQYGNQVMLELRHSGAVQVHVRWAASDVREDLLLDGRGGATRIATVLQALTAAPAEDSSL